MSNKKVYIISGPTATGKTKISIALAKQLEELTQRPIVINFDSLLFYKEISIGTAKPSPEEINIVKHELINFASIKNPVNASEFLKLAQATIKKSLDDGYIPILVGGSGFYLRALLKGMYASQSVPDEIKNKISSIYQSEGINPFLEILKENDPASFSVLHENDHYRILRAIEHFWTTGKPISLEREKLEDKSPYDFTSNLIVDWDICHLYLDIPKEDHWEIIQNRTQTMINNGLEDEVRGLLKSGHTGEEKPLKSIGYKEMFHYINSEDFSLTECAERISISTRQLAKAQRTWLKKVIGKEQFNPLTQEKEIMDYLIKSLS
jgi:tRNA dimethylallyltransferase